MESLFGISMNAIMIVMLVLLLLSFAAVIYIAIRRPVIFRMGIRNIPRRKTQSLLIIVGLMLATLITSAALSVGDSLNYSLGNAVFEVLDKTDEIVVAGNPESDEANLEAVATELLPADAVETVRNASADLPVDAVGGVLVSNAPVISLGSAPGDVDASNPQALFQSAEASEPNVGIISADQQTFNDFEVKDVDGNVIDVDQLGADKVYVNEKLADNIDVEVGDTIVYVLNNEFISAEIVGITPNSFATGSFMNLEQPGMVVGYDHLRQATGNAEGWSAVMISNDGDARGGADHSDTVSDSLKSSFEGTSLKLDSIKASFIENAELTGSIFVTMFIGFGLFSISVGVLLIVLIFTMLAAERRGEMGMMRAIGGQRRQLVQQFMSEGAGYTLLSGLVGAALGVGAAAIISMAVGNLTGGLFTVSLHVTPRSLIIAYALGVVITFMAVIFSSNRASRLNVVAALRDIPEVTNLRQSKKPLIFAGFGIILGALLVYMGETRPNISLFLIGITLIPFALAAIASWYGANTKLVFTLVGLFVLVVWGMPTKQFEAIFGEMGDGGIELFLLSGISMVAASTMIIMQHMDLLLRAVQMLGNRVKGWLAAVRLGVSYPRANGGRSGMTIAMFSLIVFSIVVMASVNNIFMQAFLGGNAMAGLDVRVDVMGESRIDDVSAELKAAGVDLNGVSEPGRMETVGPLLDQVQVTKDGETKWESSTQVSAVDQSFLNLTEFKFGKRAQGYESDEAVREALINEPNTVVVSSSMVSTGSANQDAMQGSPDLIDLGEVQDDVFAPKTITMRGSGGEDVELKVIGVLDADYSMFFGYFIGEPTLEGIGGESESLMTTFFFNVDDSRDHEEVAADMEKALLPYGAQGIDIEQQLREFQAQQSGFMTVLQWFMGLGLIVGIAAVGVISYRAVVERRQQIGVLRALGYQAKTIGRAFVIETGIIVILGSLAGVILGLIVSYNLTSDPSMSGEGGVTFTVPWMTVGVTLALAIGMALLMSWLPARQASRTLPAEALRYE